MSAANRSGSSDNLRRVAIASQAIGFVLIIALETWLGDAARPWQGVTLAGMLVTAAWLALVRRYRRNRRRRLQESDEA
ncbi:hypothetical protein [Salinicola rhizosphaerae]|uniref:Uncharacterized protein n=1 Tax=Salinicola rhizosphaerae TaxID=1443141 RepID=A0ABQ3EE92_9GAMM|nr:hypothetical protein [Salinicola rhizosphaerae]GHB33637.1 hypothetical protein GCM10009038_35770 [Salinicola rhizosphaerae]